MAVRTPEIDVVQRDSNQNNQISTQSGADAAWGVEIMLPGARFASDAAYLQQGDDLVLVGKDGTTFVVRGYFLTDSPPDLITPEGGRLTPALVQSFTPPEAAGQYAQIGQIAQAAEPIGQVKDITGQAFAVRADGTRAALSAGDSVFQGDVIETADGGAINMVFLDKTTFALGSDARLALDEMVYNPASQQGSSSFSILKGVFVFVSGEIAKTDNTKMQVNTPVATIGIRGTKVAGEIKPAGEESKFTVIDGEIAVATQGGSVVMGDRNATTTVTSFNAVPTAPVVLSQTEVNQSYSSVSSVSGGLLNNAGPAQDGPAETAPTGPADNGSDGNSEGGPDAAGEGGPEGGEQEAAGEGEGGGEGEGEGAAESEGEGAAEAEGAGGEGEGAEAQLAGVDAAPGQEQGGEGGGEQVADGEGAAGSDGAEGGGDAEGGGEGEALADRALQGTEEGAVEGDQQEAGGEGGEAGDAQAAGGAGTDGQEAGPEGQETDAIGDGPTDGTGSETANGGDTSSLGSTGGEQGPDGPGSEDGVGGVVDGGGFLSGGPTYGSGDIFSGPTGDFGGLGDPYSGGFGTTDDPFGSGDLATDFGDFGSADDPFGDAPPPPDDPNNEELIVADDTIAIDSPINDDRSAEVTPQTIIGATGDDTLTGGSGADILDGLEGNDTLIGNAGDDTIFADSGDDIVIGGAGNDFLVAGSGLGFDSYDGGAGTDTLSFSSTFLGVIADTSTGTASGSEIDSDTFTGIEVLIGGAGADFLDGDAGVNQIFGGAGDDTIDGAGGVDTIFGGAGDDTIGFDTSAETIDGGAGIDKIRLFGSGQTADNANLVAVGSIEEIDLSGVGSNTLSVNSALVTTVSGTGTLAALGDGDDIVESDSNWNLTGPFTLGTLVFDQFTDGGSTVISEVSSFRSNATINFNAGAALTYSIENLGSLTTSDGTYTNNGSILLGASGDIDMSGSKTLGGTGTFTNQQSMSLLDDTVAATLDGGTGTLGIEGTITVNGKLILGPATTVDGGTLAVLNGTGTLQNQGTQVIDDTAIISVDSLINQGVLSFNTLTSTVTSATIDNAAGGVVSFAADTLIDMAPGQTLTNNGLAQLQGTANLDFLDGLIANAGTLDIVAAASTLTVNNGEISMLAGGTVTGAGSLLLNSSNFSVDTGVGFTLGSGGSGPHLDIILGNITGGGTLVNESDLVIDGATTISVATLTNSTGGILDHADGTLNVTSVFENQAASSLIVDTTVTNTEISFTNDFTNSGMVRFVGANQGVISVGGGAGTLVNAATGTVQVLDGDNILNSVLVNPTGGVIEVNATGTGLARLAHSSAFTNQGLIHLTAGTLGTETAIFDQGSGFTLTNTGTIAMDGGVSGALLELSGDLDNQGLISVNTLAETRIVPNTGVNGTMTNSGTVSINSGSELFIGLDTGATGITGFTNTGTLDATGALTLRQTTLTQTGSLQIVSGGAVNVIENSKLDLGVDFTSVVGSTIAVGNGTATGEISGAGTFFNAGFLTLNNGTLSGNVNENSGSIAIQGASNVNSGVLEFSSNATLNFVAAADKLANSGTIDVNGNSTLTVTTGTLENLAAGTINVGGTGTIDTASGGIFSDSGTTNFGLSPGSLTIGGDMIRGDSAFMLFELGGLTPGVGGFDQLTVTGELDAGGTLDVVEFGGFDVAVGDSFQIVNAGTITNSFREISGLDEVGGGVVLDAVQSASGVTLNGRAVTHQGASDDDTLTGGTGDDVFVGAGGNDFIVSGGGADLMHGGAGDDVFVAADTGFGRIDGGGGTDTLRFDGGGFNLTTLRGDQLSNVERIDITGSGDNTLTLDADIALGGSGGTNPLTGAVDSLLIDGDSGDAVAAQGAWTNTGTVTIDGNGYSVFESDANGAEIHVDSDVAVNLV